MLLIKREKGSDQWPRPDEMRTAPLLPTHPVSTFAASTKKKMNGQPKFIDATSWPVCVNESEFSTRDAADIKLASIFFFKKFLKFIIAQKIIIFFPFSCKKKKDLFLY